MRKLLCAAALLLPLAASAQLNLAPFQPASVLTVSANTVYRMTASGTSTPFQLPSLGVVAGAGRVQVTVVDEGASDLCVAFGAMQSNVSPLVVPSLGTGTVGTAGNCHTVKAGNSIIWTVPDNAWFNIQTLSGTSNLSIEVGLGS